MNEQLLVMIIHIAAQLNLGKKYIALTLRI